MLMLIFHIVSSCVSIIASCLLLFVPSKALLRVTYAMTAVMLASGTLLTIVNTAHLVEACVVGLLIISVVVFAIVSAQRRLNQA